MLINDKLRRRYAEPDVHVQYHLTGSYLTDRISLALQDSETGESLRIMMTRDEARLIAKRLVDMADQCDKGQQWAEPKGEQDA